MNQQSQDKSFIVSWDQLHRDGRALAWRLEAMVQSGRNWSRLMAVTRGGMAPAMIVARELDIRVVDSVSVRSYDHQTQMEPQVIKEPFLEDSEDMLVIDDLVDTGRTLDLVRRLFPPRISRPYTPSPRDVRSLTPLSPRSARIPGSIFPGTRRCSISDRCVPRRDS